MQPHAGLMTIDLTRYRKGKGVMSGDADIAILDEKNQPLHKKVTTLWKDSSIL